MVDNVMDVIGVRAWPESTASVRPLYVPRRSDYKDYVLDLQFAIDAGDTVIAPAMKLLLREAINLAHNSAEMTAACYQTQLESVKVAYQSLLNINTSHPVARRLQERYKLMDREQFWSFLEQEKLLSKTAPQAQIIVSDGNINKHLYFILKRCLDFTMAVVLIVIFMPLIALIATLIEMDSPGSAFFLQERVGARRRTRGGQTIWEIRNFKIVKFRTMVQDCDQSLHQDYIQRWVGGQVEESNDPQAKFKLTKDKRVTRIGRILRKTSLDELPQLFNILRGEMSLVGPRPVPIYEFILYEGPCRERQATIPGLTGLWQVKGRGQVTFPQQINMDLEYIHQQSFWLDLKIMLLTIPSVLSSRGAR